MFHKIFFYYFYKHFKRKLSRLQTKKINNKKQCFELILKKLWIVLRCWACIDCVVAWMMYILGIVGNCVDPYSHIHRDSILDANDSPRKLSRGWSFGISFPKWGARWALRSTSNWGVSSWPNKGWLSCSKVGVTSSSRISGWPDLLAWISGTLYL